MRERTASSLEVPWEDTEADAFTWFEELVRTGEELKLVPADPRTMTPAHYPFEHRKRIDVPSRHAFDPLRNLKRPPRGVLPEEP